MVGRCWIVDLGRVEAKGNERERRLTVQQR